MASATFLCAPVGRKEEEEDPQKGLEMHAGRIAQDISADAGFPHLSKLWTLWELCCCKKSFFVRMLKSHAHRKCMSSQGAE